MALLGGVNDWLRELAEVIQNGVGIYRETRDVISGADDSSSSAPVLSTNPTYDPNLSLGDFTFTPNWLFIGVGLFLLLLVYIAKK